MPAIIAMLLGGLIRIVGQLAAQVLVALGIGVVTYSGVSMGIEAIQSPAVGAVALLPPPVFGMRGLLKVGVCMNIIFSAVAARMVINGASSTIKRFQIK